MIRPVTLKEYQTEMHRRKTFGRTTRTFMKIGNKVFETTGATLGAVARFRAEQKRLANAQEKLL